MEKKYVISFFTAFFSLAAILFGFITWMNPDRITNAPWSIDFVSDRNMAFKKFALLKDNTSYTDLIVGSSTSEVFVPEMLQKNHGIAAYLGGIGGSKTPLKYAQIQSALKDNPHLKRIIYVTDLFEFADTNLETGVYYQNEIMDEIPAHLREQLSAPDWVSRLQDYFSEPAIKNAAKTFSDYKKYKSGKYESLFRADGSTARSMVEFNSKEDIAPRVLRIAKTYEGIYNNIKLLDPTTVVLIEEITKAAKERNVEIVFVIAPWHSLFFKHFESRLSKNNDIYTNWIQFIRGLESPGVRVVDYSYPKSLYKGIGDEKEYWNDGVHFSLKSAEIILNEVYSKSSLK